MLYEEQIWVLINGIISGLVVIPLAVLWPLTLYFVRQGDRARVGFSWLKTAHPFLFLCLVFVVIADALDIAWHDEDNAGRVVTTTWGVSQEHTTSLVEYINATAYLLQNTVEAILIIMLAELGNGFMVALTPLSAVPPHMKTIRHSAFAVSISLLAIASTAFGINVTMMYKMEKNVYPHDAKRTIAKMGGSLAILYWIVAVIQVAHATYVVQQHKAQASRWHAAKIYLIATILRLTRATAFLVYNVAWVLPNTQTAPIWVAVEAIVNYWVLFSILALLFVIGIRKKDGLWSTQQKWMKSPITSEYEESQASNHTGTPLGSPYYLRDGWPQQLDSSPIEEMPAGDVTELKELEAIELKRPQEMAA